MESSELKRVINALLFVPIEDGFADRLHDVSMSFMNDLDFGLVEGYTRSFIQNEISLSFKGLFNTKFKEKYNESLLVPDIVYLVLETYVIYLAVQSDTFDVESRFEFSLIVKNTSVLRKGNWDGIVCPEWIAQMYAFSNENRTPVVSTCSYADLIVDVIPYDNWEDTALNLNDPNIFSQIRSLCAAGIQGCLSFYVEGKSFKSMSSPFAQMYSLVIRMVKDWKWRFIAASPVGKLKKVFGSNTKKRKSLSNIVSDIKVSLPETQIIKPSMSSSVLLKRIYGGTTTTIDGTLFSLLEFGVYLYYEMVLETNDD